MASTIVTLTLALAAGSAGQTPLQRLAYRILPPGGRIVSPGPGYGYGFANGNPDGYGWVDYKDALPLTADRTPEYYFPRHNAIPPVQMFLPSYYNAYPTRGQRYIAYAGCGGEHPMSGPPLASAATPAHPYQESIGIGPRVQVPPFSGRVEAPAVNTGGTGLTP